MLKEYRHKNNPPGHHGQEGFDLSCSYLKAGQWIPNSEL